MTAASRAAPSTPPRRGEHGFNPWTALAAAAGGAALVVGAVAYIRRAERRAEHRADDARRQEPDRGAGSPVTQADERINPATADLGRPGRNVEERLDEALQETFPTSDPIAVHIE